MYSLVWALLVLSVTSCGSLFTNTVSYRLQHLGTPNLSLKNEQFTTIQVMYNGKDVFVWLPTGFDNSLCYQAIPIILDCKIDVFGPGQSFTACKTSVVLGVSKTLNSDPFILASAYSKSSLWWGFESDHHLNTLDVGVAVLSLSSTCFHMWGYSAKLEN